MDDDEARRGALRRFLTDGLPAQPVRAVLVDALAAARRAVQQHKMRPTDLSAWLVHELRFEGVRPNAAMLAVLEATGAPPELVSAYLQHYPRREWQISVLASSIRERSPDLTIDPEVVALAVAAVQQQRTARSSGTDPPRSSDRV